MPDTKKTETIPIKVMRITDNLPVPLTDDERLDFADSLAEANRAVHIAYSNKANAMQQHNSEIKLAEARRDKISGIVASKKEYREVVVEQQWDYEKDKYSEIRTDTGEILFSRRLTDVEKQLQLEDVLPEAKDSTEKDGE